MNVKWDQKLFDKFVHLRDALRKAKRDKNYQLVLSLGLSIIELDKTASFLKIATFVFLKDMAEASIKLDDTNTAINYLQAAKNELEQKNTVDWQGQIDIIERKINKLQSK